METFVFKPFGRLRFHFRNRGNYARKVPTHARGPGQSSGYAAQGRAASTEPCMRMLVDAHRNRRLTLTAQRLAAVIRSLLLNPPPGGGAVEGLGQQR